jgi:hypothetical protein
LAFAAANSSTDAAGEGAAGEAAALDVFVFVGVAVSVQADAARPMATHVRASAISFIRRFLQFVVFYQKRR